MTNTHTPTRSSAVAKPKAGKTGKFFQCDSCTESFDRAHDLGEHRKLHRLPDHTDSDLELQDWQKQPNHTASKFFQCEACAESFDHADDFGEHRRLHKQRDRTASKFFQCEACSESYDHAHEFAEHRRLHEHRDHAASDLQKWIAQSESSFFKSHDKAFFKSHDDLVMALEKANTVATPKAGDAGKFFQCEHCPESFGYAHEFGEHRKLHQQPDHTASELHDWEEMDGTDSELQDWEEIGGEEARSVVH